MSKELHSTDGANAEVVAGMLALPDPGGAKKLIIFVSASSVRLRIEPTSPTIEGQEPESGDGSHGPPP